MKLGKYKRAKKKLEKLSRLYGSAELWLLLAKAPRKTGSNGEAKETIKQSLAIKHDYNEALIEQNLTEQKVNRKQRLEAEITLEQQRLDEKLHPLREGQQLITTNQANEIQRTHDRMWYNILSIDGGGFRGQDNYHRWQVWFEDEIPLDQYSTKIKDILEDHAYTFLEELAARDDNKRLGVIMERLS
ncbi:unnamed protein product [Rotaria sordida]|uniref:Uncharacterized protein n=1 Tax=Rotaria sordida TaxID=392033 RepID=A0A819SMZ1_9BILA|nr:unnamed protein product [Rotaria sordida]CAF4065487.1 unnamed protein product [Rotaria sordida]CAF4177218.1 unnamed protein product [Rotaria sordida]